MGHIFISHVEKDAAIMQQIARGLEADGYTPKHLAEVKLK